MTTLEWVLIALGVAWVGSITVVVVGVRMLYLRVRRSRALKSAALRTRMQLSWGPRREVMRLRTRLDDTVASGQAAMALVARGEVSRGELPRLFRRIQAEAGVLESQLRLMATEVDPEVLADELPLARRRVDLVAGLVRRVRSVVSDSLAAASDNALAMLQSDVDREVIALRAGLEELHALSRDESLYGPESLPMTARPNRGELT